MSTRKPATPKKPPRSSTSPHVAAAFIAFTQEVGYPNVGWVGKPFRQFMKSVVARPTPMTPNANRTTPTIVTITPAMTTPVLTYNPSVWGMGTPGLNGFESTEYIAVPGPFAAAAVAP